MPTDDTITPEQFLPHDPIPFAPVAPEAFTITGDPAPLFAALAVAQLEFTSIVKDQEGKVQGDRANYTYSYANLASTIEGTRGALNRAGLAFLQPFTIQDGWCVVRTIIAHSSGAMLCATSTFSAEQEGKMSKWQALGSAITYCRRYSAQAMMGVSPAEDDDGVSAPAPVRQPQPAQNRQAPPSQPQPKPTPKPAAKPAEAPKPVAKAKPVEPEPAPEPPPVIDEDGVVQDEEDTGPMSDALRDTVRKILLANRVPGQQVMRDCQAMFQKSPENLTQAEGAKLLNYYAGKYKGAE